MVGAPAASRTVRSCSAGLWMAAISARMSSQCASSRRLSSRCGAPGRRVQAGPISSFMVRGWKASAVSAAYAVQDARKGGTSADNHAASLRGLPQHPEAAIPVERIAGPLLLVCGEADQPLWPSCAMARQVDQRLREHRRPVATLLAYQDVGRSQFGLPVAPDDPRLTAFGGTAEAANAARSDSWQKAIAFLRASLRRWQLALRHSGASPLSRT